jgi:hypothetical protein
MYRLLLPLLALGILLGGCRDSTSPRDTIPPVAPRGLYSVTGDGEVTLHWVGNSESDLAAYRIWINEDPCTGGTDCSYKRIGELPASPGREYVEYVVTGLTNGEPHFFAVSAVDRRGNDSPLSYEDVWDTPRPAGIGRRIQNYLTAPGSAGYDFSAYTSPSGGVLDWRNLETDIFYGYFVDDSGYVYQQVFAGPYADIQDAGYASSLDAVDFAPDSSEGWSANWTVEALVGHCYVVWTWDNHFAKFRITEVQPGRVTFDWAYQTDPGNRELRARRVVPDGGADRRPIVWLRH